MPAAEARGVTFLRREMGTSVYRVRSGDYEFVGVER